MTSLLNINDSMNVFSLNIHSGDRPLYDNLIALGERFPQIIEDINMNPLSSLAVERDEEAEYGLFRNRLDSITSSLEKDKSGPRLGQ